MIRLLSSLFLYAEDVKEWIEHNNITHMMNTVDEDEKLMQTILASGQNRGLCPQWTQLYHRGTTL